MALSLTAVRDELAARVRELDAREGERAAHLDERRGRAQRVARAAGGAHEGRADVRAHARRVVPARGDGERAERVGEREDEPAVERLREAVICVLSLSTRVP